MSTTADNAELTIAEAAALLGVSVKTVERLRDAGEFGYTTRGRRVFYRQGDLKDYQRRSAVPVPPKRAS